VFLLSVYGKPTNISPSSKLSDPNDIKVHGVAITVYTDNGWTEDYVGLEWLQNHFSKFAISRPEKTRHLLCDNHPPHDNYEFYENCLANDIALFFIPSHATHILQPLDVGVFSLLDRYCSQEVDDWTVSRPLYTSPLKGDFLPMYERARKKVVTAHNMKAT